MEMAGPNGLEPSSSSSTGRCTRLSATAPKLGGTSGFEPAWNSSKNCLLDGFAFVPTRFVNAERFKLSLFCF